jgi:hypothetical protein
MVRMSDDEKFDAWLKDVASEYNRPPVTVPREAMWQAIAPALPVTAQADVTLLRPGHRVRRWVPLAAAAAMLVAVSYQVGRLKAPSSSTSPAAPVTAATPPRPENAMYAKAADQHLGRAEALLTSVRSFGVEEAMEPSLHLWARELLSDTRLLLDSPASNDVVRQKLLQDLELTLAQIVQLSAASTPDDQRMVERSLRRGELLTRIRTAVPSLYSGT